MNTQDLANSVRNWVHYDNLCTSFSKQSQNARRVRDEFEDKIIQQLVSNNMEKAVIQIQGGRLSVVEEKHTQPLTLSRVEESLKEYFTSPGVGPDQTANIMKFLKNHRQVEVSKKLKKQVALPPLPPPPSGPPSLA
jgi:hypothetical protein